MLVVRCYSNRIGSPPIALYSERRTIVVVGHGGGGGGSSNVNASDNMLNAEE